MLSIVLSMESDLGKPSTFPGSISEPQPARKRMINNQKLLINFIIQKDFHIFESILSLAFDTLDLDHMHCKDQKKA